MKFLTLFIFLFILTPVFATNYYFSDLSGQDSYTSTQAQSPNTPWKTINKLNSYFASLKPGDNVYFKGGETYYGVITINKSGIAGAPITISSYGGDKAIITGLSTLSNWAYTGNGIWESYNANLGTIVNTVLLNGVAREMGRYPNSNASNSGYLNYESHPAYNAITDNELSSSGAPNWTGAEVVVRKFRYILDRHVVTGQSGNTIYYNQGKNTYTPTDRNGYFIQNHIGTLDQLGEWYYSPGEKKLKMFFGANQASNFAIKASTLDYLVVVNNQRYITFDNLTFQGGNVNGINIVASENISITNSNIANTGVSGILASNTNNLRLEGCYVSYSNNNGIDIGNENNYAVIKNNKVEYTSLFAGMGQSSDGNGLGIAAGGTGMLIEENKVFNTGYSAIAFEGDNVLVKNNFIDRYCVTKDDGGGIYTLGIPGTQYTGRKIIGNIVINGIGAGAGTDDVTYLPVMALYFDNNATGVEVRDNTVANTSFQGIIFLNAHDIVVTNNTFFNNKNQLAISDFGADLIRNNYFANNIFFSKTTEQKVSSLSSVRNDFGLWGLFQNNYYCRPLDDKLTITTNYLYNNLASSKTDAYDIEGWKNLLEVTPQKSPIQIPAYTVNSTNSGNKFANGTFNSNIGYPANYSPVNNIKTTWNSGGKLDGGCFQFSYQNQTGKGELALSAYSVGSAGANKKYLVNFSLLGAVNNKSLSVYLRNSSDPYNGISNIQYVKLSTTRTENELLLTVNSSVSSADLVFEVNDQCGSFWVDNVEVKEVDVTYTNPDDYIRFEYNPSAGSITVALDGTYVDVKNNSYSNSITLQPYTSAVLIRTTKAASAPVQLPSPDQLPALAPIVDNPLVTDQTPPTIVAKNITVQTDASGQATIKPTDIIQSITDNTGVDNSSIQISQTQFACQTVSSAPSTASSNHQAYATSTTSGVQVWGGELGMVFKVNNAAGITIDALGAFDHQGNGITGTQNGGVRVAIFNKATQTIVPGLDAIVVGQADGYNLGHRFKIVQPVTLLPGEYVVVAKGYNVNELNGNSGMGSPLAFGDLANGAITQIGNSLYGTEGSSFNYPTNADAGKTYLAGTFSFSVLNKSTTTTTTATSSAAHQAYAASTTSGVQVYKGELGMVFKVNNAAGITIDALGAFDHQGNGITGTQNGGIRVAIFNKETKTIVPGLDAIVIGQADGYNLGHRFKSVQPVTLLPGEYVVVAKGYNENELNGNSGMGSPFAFGDLASGAITQVSNSLYGTEGSSFNYPNNVDGGKTYLAGTFSFSTITAVQNSSVNTVTITAKDIYGNLAQATATVTVVCSQAQAQRQVNTSTASNLTQPLQLTKDTAIGIKGAGLNIFPNPTTGRFTVQLSNIKTPQVTIEILSENGMSVTRKSVNTLGASSAKIDFDLTNQSSGVYFVKVVGVDSVKTGKVLIQRQ